MWVMAVASAIAIPLGLYIGHTGRGRGWAVGITGAARALPTFGLLLYLVLAIGVERRELAAVIALVLLAIPPLLAGAYSGVDQIDRRVLDAAKAQGMTGWQLLFRVELPLALPLVVGGIRNAALQVVATVTLIAYVGLGGLGYDIIQGIPLRRFDQMIGSALAILVIALLLDALFAALTRVVNPEGVRKAGGGDIRARESSRRLDTRAR
jgi:osmoprotectant transport system permease protein